MVSCKLLPGSHQADRLSKTKPPQAGPPVWSEMEVPSENGFRIKKI